MIKIGMIKIKNMKKILLFIGLFICFYSFGQIDSISNNESGASVRATLNQAIDSVNELLNRTSGISYNESEGMYEFRTGDNNVVWQGALEDLVQVYNNTGTTMPNGTPFYLSGSNGDSISTANFATANIYPAAVGIRGLITGDILNNSWGYGCVRGKVRMLNTESLSLIKPAYLTNDSAYNDTAAAYPSEKIIIGGCLRVDNDSGIVYVQPTLGLRRQLKTKSYAFTSQGISSGTYWKAGFYDASSTDANLTQASTSITYGVSDIAYEAHPFAVYGGPGAVTGGGRVALITTGTSYDDRDGSQIAFDVDTIINDITNAVLNIYDETKKYLGTVTYELVVVEGAPTSYSLDFNYGYAKYDDINDRDFYITGIEAVWQGNGNDASGFDIALYKHSQTGWTYAATGFEPGNSVIARMSDDHVGFRRVSNNVDAAWKRSMENTFVNGNGGEGFVIQVITGVNSTIQIKDIHVEVAIDQ